MFSSLRFSSSRFCSFSKRFFCSSTEKNYPIYELRWYTISPEYFPSFLKLTNEKIHMRTAHSPVLGYWTTELGGLNEVVHIWGYESLVQRQQIRNALAKDSKWNDEYMSVMRPMLTAQENVIMTPTCDITTNFALLDEDDLTCYELEVIVSPDDEIDNDSVRSGCGGQLVGEWKGIIGTMNGSNIQVWRYPTLSHLDDILRTKKSNVEVQQFNKVMLATPFSPLS